MGMVRPGNACAIRLKLHGLNLNLQGCNRTLVGSTSATGARRSHGFGFCSWYALAGGRGAASACKGRSGEPTLR